MRRVPTPWRIHLDWIRDFFFLLNALLKNVSSIITQMKTSFFPFEWLENQKPLYIGTCTAYLRQNPLNRNNRHCICVFVNGKLHFQTNKSPWMVHYKWQIRDILLLLLLLLAIEVTCLWLLYRTASFIEYSSKIFNEWKTEWNILVFYLFVYTMFYIDVNSTFLGK